MSSLVDDFLKHLEAEKRASPKTLENYRHYLRRFLELAGDIQPLEITLPLVRKFRLVLESYRDPLTNKPLKKNTQNYFLIALRAFLSFLANQSITSLSAKKVKLGETESSPIKILDHGSLRKLLEAPDVSSKSGLRDRALLETIFSTGLRVSEVASLNRDIDLTKQEVTVLGRGFKKRSVFLSDSSVKWLGQYLKSRKDNFRPLFIRYQGQVDLEAGGEKMRLTARSIQRIVEKYVKGVGLSVKATPHTLRHNLATDLLAKGLDTCSVGGILGHAHLSTTQIYTHLTRKKGFK